VVPFFLNFDVSDTAPSANIIDSTLIYEMFGITACWLATTMRNLVFNLSDKCLINKDVTEDLLTFEISSSVAALCHIKSFSVWNKACE
jgi:hypothetical protein